MSFAPADYLELAKKLADEIGKQQQAAFRSAISRGYYSVFLTIKERVLDEGFDFPESESHKEVSNGLNGISGHARRIRSELDKLRFRRNEADYDLPGKTYSPERTAELVERCERLKGSCESARDSLYRRLGKKLNPERPDPRHYL